MIGGSFGPRTRSVKTDRAWIPPLAGGDSEAAGLERPVLVTANAPVWPQSQVGETGQLPRRHKGGERVSLESMDARPTASAGRPKSCYRLQLG